MLGYKKSWDNSKVQTDGLNLDYNTSDYTADNIGAAEADLTDRINSEGVVLLKMTAACPWQRVRPSACSLPTATRMQVPV